jgi:hypothetical protein
MVRSSDLRRGIVSLLWLAVPTLGAGPARADDKAACIAANDSANTLRQQGKLREAKKQYLSCAEAKCPKVVRDECLDRVSSVEASIPTIVVAVVDAKGIDVTRGKVLLDGEQVSEVVDGRAEAVDPGEHRVRFEAEDGTSAELSFVARQGEKNRTVKLSLEPVKVDAPAATSRPEVAPPPAIPADEHKGSSGTLGWVFGGVGVVALGSFSYFALTGKSEENDLESRCAPRCKQSEADSLHQKYLFADISLGVALLSMGAATYFFLSDTSPEKPPSAAWSLRAGPTRGGFALGASGRF